jgi:hypothetical protein
VKETFLNEDKFRSAVWESPAVKRIAKEEAACLIIAIGIGHCWGYFVNTKYKLCPEVIELSL